MSAVPSVELQVVLTAQSCQRDMTERRRCPTEIEKEERNAKKRGEKKRKSPPEVEKETGEKRRKNKKELKHF